MDAGLSYAIGIDLGATKIAAALVDRSGSTLASRQALTLAAEGVAPVLDRIASLAASLAALAPAPVLGVGIGAPGQVDSRQGVTRNAVNLGWGEVYLAEEISSRLAGMPVWIQKDANLSALGEYYFGAAQGCEDFVFLGVGSGLGGGIFVNGSLVAGAAWNAAEVGHLSLDPAGWRCACGNLGCAETVVSGPGLVRSVADLGSRAETRSPLLDQAELTPAEVLSAARQGDPLALQALERVGGWLGVVAAACVALLNPARLVIGGGLGIAAFDFLHPALQEELRRRTLPGSRASLQILPSQVESSAVGAACLVWYSSRLSAILPKEEVTP